MFRIFFDSTATKLRFQLSPLGSNYEFFSPFLSSSSYFVLLFSSFYGAPGREWCRGCKNRRRVVIEGARAWGCFYEKGEWCEFTARFEEPTLNAELYPRFHLIDPLSITYKNVFFISLSLRDRWNIPSTLRILSYIPFASNITFRTLFFCVEREIVLLCHCIDFAIALNTALLLNAVIHLRFSSIGSPFTAHRNVLFTFFSHERNSEYFKNLFIAFERCILLTSNVMSLRRPFFYLQCTMVFVASLRRCIEHSVIATNTASSRCCVNTLTATVAIFFFFRIFLEWLK